MGRALVVCGSARMNGVTDSMSRSAVSALERAGYDVSLEYVTDDIVHCRDCGLCTDGQCAIDDAMSPIYEAFSESDLLVLVTPIHFSGPSSLIKTVMDRFQPYWFVKDMPHPSRMMVLMCGGSEDPEFRPTIKIMKAFAAMLGMEWMGHLEVSGTDRTKGEDAPEAVARFIERAVSSEAERWLSRIPVHPMPGTRTGSSMGICPRSSPTRRM